VVMVVFAGSLGLHFHSCMVRVFFNCSLPFGLVWSILQYEGFFYSRLGVAVARGEVKSHIGLVEEMSLGGGSVGPYAHHDKG